jgi:G3E family GTPase
MHIPVTLVAGYLGAGKTTLLNRLLSGDHGRRLAVLVNDFGSVNIDSALIAAHDDQTISLANGCICCAISDDLGTALQAQVERHDRPDHLVIEASGVADAGRLARLVGGWPGLSLSTVVTLANAATLPGLIADKYVGSLVRRQLQAADLVALTGTDLADPGPARAIAAAHAPGAPVIEVPFGAISPELLLGPDARSERRYSSGASALPPLFCATAWKPSRPVSTDAFHIALDSLPPEIHRLKGFLRDPAGRTWVVQRVGRRCTLEAASPTAPAESVIVMIAAGPEAALDEAIELLDALC